MKYLTAPLFLTVLLTCTGSGAVVADESTAAVSVTTLRGPLHMLRGQGGNVLASVGIDGILLVDDDYDTLADAYQQVISVLSNSDLAPSFVLNTHWHGDHTGSNKYWGTRGATIVAHTNVRARLAGRQQNPVTGKMSEPSPASALPVVTFDSSLALHFNGSDIEVQHYPAGHTDGDGVVFFSKENVIHMGDLFFKDAFPFVDIGSGGTLSNYIANVESVLSRVQDDTQIVPGHGSLANKTDLKRFHAMLLETTAQVKAALAQGMTPEAIAKKGLGKKWASWGNGFIKEANWIATIATSP